MRRERKRKGKNDRKRKEMRKHIFRGGVFEQI